MFVLIFSPCPDKRPDKTSDYLKRLMLAEKTLSSKCSALSVEICCHPRQQPVLGLSIRPSCPFLNRIFTKEMTTPSFLEMQAEVCKTFANPKRIEIIDILKNAEKTTSELVAELGTTKSNISQHLTNRFALGAGRKRR